MFALLRKLPRRLRLLRGYLSPRRNFPISFRELIWDGVAKPPCTFIGRRFVERIDHKADYLVVKLREVATPLYWPAKLPLADLYKVLTECFYDPDWHFYEAPETQVEGGDFVLDCGAAEGVFSLRIADRAARIASFEPLPLFTHSLQKTFASCDNVEVVPMALGDCTGKAFLTDDSLYSSISSDAGIPIEMTTIDAWTSNVDLGVDFIKADVEGGEHNLILGAAETIRSCRPKIALTVYHHQNDWQQILYLLKQLVPEYKHRVKGLSADNGQTLPVMLHCWLNKR